MGSSIEYDEHDQSIIAKLEARFGHHTAEHVAAAFDIALAGRASEVLLQEIARLYTERVHTMAVGREHYTLPYIPKLLAAGYEPSLVRDIFVRLSLQEGHYGEHRNHQRGFWHTPEAQELFDTAESLLAYCLAYAKLSPGDIIDRHDTLAYCLGRLRRPHMRAAEWEKLVETGKADARLVMLEAARNVPHLRNDRQLEILLELPMAEQSRAAAGMIPAGPAAINTHACLLMGNVLAKCRGPQAHGIEPIIAAIRRACGSSPKWTPEIYRWVLEGIRRAEGDGYWQMSKYFEQLRWAVQGGGWQFMRLVSRDNPRRPGQSDLQVELRGGKGRIVLKHDNRGARYDRLHEGDEVIVSAEMVKQHEPVFTGPTLAIYVVELHPAAPPSFKMEDARKSTNRYCD